jgi:hypothetical protein
MLVDESLVLLSQMPFVSFRKTEPCLEGGNLADERLLAFFGLVEEFPRGFVVVGG